jgi:hypothetical protein
MPSSRSSPKAKCYIRRQFSNLLNETLKTEAASTSETWATSSTPTQSNNPETELTSTINHGEGLKWVGCASLCEQYLTEWCRSLCFDDDRLWITLTWHVTCYKHMYDMRGRFLGTRVSVRRYTSLQHRVSGHNCPWPLTWTMCSHG